MENLFDFNDCTALIAGGATGLGYEMTRGLLSAGCKVAIAGRTRNRVMSVAKDLSDNYNGKCYGFEADISTEDSINLLTEKVRDVFNGKLNIAINSAGINVRNPISKVSLIEWENIQKINLTGGFLFAKSLFPLLRGADFGRLINVTSIFSTRSFQDRISYSSSKGGLLQLTKTLAIEWAPYNITVNAISPGPFLTDLNKPVLDNPENYRNFCRNIPLNRFGEPAEIVTACLFLASRFSSYVTGADIMVDGGWTAT